MSTTVDSVTSWINTGNPVSDSTMYSLMQWAYPENWRGWLLSAVGAIISETCGSLIGSTWLTASSNAFTENVSMNAIKYSNVVTKITIDPNISGIPIKSASETITRDVDVSEQTTIVEDTGKGREYVTDSAAPKPREFHVTGYLAPLVKVLDQGWLIKPTLKFQIAWLDSLSKVRIPIWYKSYYGEVVRVLISNLRFEHDPKAQNAVAVDVTLREYVELSITMDVYGNAVSNEVDIDAMKAENTSLTSYYQSELEMASTFNAPKSTNAIVFPEHAKSILETHSWSSLIDTDAMDLMLHESLINKSNISQLSSALSSSWPGTDVSSIGTSEFYSIVKSLNILGGL